MLNRSAAIFLAALALGTLSGCAKDLSGEWTGWGAVKITGTQGTYTDTYGTGPGTFKFEKAGSGYQGTWGESPKRHGVFNFTVSDDGRTLSGSWKADDDCEIKPGAAGGLEWKRKP